MPAGQANAPSGDPDLEGPAFASVDPGALPPLTDAQWASPEAVAARAILLLTNHPFDEPPGAVTQRLAPYCTAAFQAELTSSNTGTAQGDILASDRAVAVGHISATTIETNDSHTASVIVWAATGIIDVADARPPLEPDPYRVLLVRQPDGRWLVAGITP